MHLETIIKDLRERFARCELRVSPPLTAFRESVFREAEAPEPGQKPVKARAPACINRRAVLGARCKQYRPFMYTVTVSFSL